MYPSFRRVMIATILAGALALSAACPASARNPFRIVANRPFETVVTGPMGAIVVDLDDVRGPLTRQACDAALRRAIAEQHSPESLAGAARTVERLKRMGLLGRRLRPRFPRAAVFVRNGRIVADTSTAAPRGRLAGTRQRGGGSITLTFEANSFLTPGEREALTDIFNEATPVINAIYGQPAETITVQVEEMAAGTSPLQGGIYIPGVPTARLQLGRFLDVPANDPGNLFAFIVLLVRAYHNTAMIDFDAWEEGFARLVATLVWESIRPTIAIDDANPFLAVPRYDAMNLPPLGTPMFFQPIFSGMLLPRISMAVTAWGKVYYEDTDFFRDFNAAYYAAFNSSLPGDSAALRTIAAGVVSEVEGVNFHDWFRRQHVLDTSASPGEGLYPWYIAFHEGDEQDEYAVALFFLHYYVDPQGEETPLPGTVDLRYTNHDRTVDIFVQEGYQSVIPGSGTDAGMGFLAPTFFPQNTGTGGQEGNGGRLFIDMRLGGFFSVLPFPYTGPGPAPTNPRGPFDIDFWGVVTPADDGEVRISASGISPVTLPVDEGMFRGRVSTAGVLDPGQYLLEYIPPGATDPTVSKLVNVVDIRQNVILPGAVALSNTSLDVPAALSLISLPLVPTVGGEAPADPADVFGISQSQLIMARWQPDDPGGSKYRFYPNVPPIEPGMGFFLKPPGPIVSLPITGIGPDPSTPVVVHLLPGWNNIGFPFNSATPLPVSQLLIAEGDPGIGLDQGIPISQAATQGLVEGSIFDFVAGRTPESDVVAQLVRFGGYWIRCLRPDGVQLIFPALGGTLARGRQAAQTPGDEWELPILATAGGRSAVVRMAGSAAATDGFDGAYDAHLPPQAPGGGVTMYFVPPQGGEPLFRDARSAAAEAAWQLEVDAHAADAEVELRWPDLTRLPRDLRPMLADESAGRRCAMRTVRQYRCRTGAGGGPRRFTVTVARGAEGALRITGLASSVARGGRSMTVSFSLTRSAATTVGIYNVAGRQVRRLTGAEALPRGINSLTWDLRANTGTPVPNGVYLCRVQSRSEDGQSAGAVAMVHVGR